MSVNAASPANVDVVTPRPRGDSVRFLDELYKRLSTDSTECGPTITSEKPHVQFPEDTNRPSAVYGRRTSFRKPGSTERIKVDEVDDAEAAGLADSRAQRSARSRSRSVMRRAGVGGRSKSRVGMRRDLSRGRGPISRETVLDEGDGPPPTEEEIARELRPESFTRFKRIASQGALAKRRSNAVSQLPTENKDKTVIGEVKETTTNSELDKPKSLVSDSQVSEANPKREIDMCDDDPAVTQGKESEAATSVDVPASVEVADEARPQEVQAPLQIENANSVTNGDVVGDGATQRTCDLGEAIDGAVNA